MKVLMELFFPHDTEKFNGKKFSKVFFKLYSVYALLLALCCIFCPTFMIDSVFNIDLLKYSSSGRIAFTEIIQLFGFAVFSYSLVLILCSVKYQGLIPFMLATIFINYTTQFVTLPHTNAFNVSSYGLAFGLLLYLCVIYSIYEIMTHNSKTKKLNAKGKKAKGAKK